MKIVQDAKQFRQDLTRQAREQAMKASALTSPREVGGKWRLAEKLVPIGI